MTRKRSEEQGSESRPRRFYVIPGTDASLRRRTGLGRTAEILLKGQRPVSSARDLSDEELKMLAEIQESGLLDADLPDALSIDDTTLEEWRDRIFGLHESPEKRRLLERLHATSLLDLIRERKKRIRRSPDRH